MKILFPALLLFFSFSAFCQDDEDDSEITPPRESTMEVGFDGYFGASNLGGAAGLGAKLGIKLNDKIILGPSLRVQRSWANNYGQKFGYTIYGGGIWMHARFLNYLFVGAEVEFLNSPQFYTFSGSPKKWVPIAFVGGGFSREFNSFRLNAGIFYDLVDDRNSPFRFSYVMRKANNALIPVIYRIGFFFPIN